jgi:hypothetical protein
MTTAQGTTAIDTALEEELAEFAQLRANQTQLSQDETFHVNTDLAAKIKARLLTDLDSAWSD